MVGARPTRLLVATLLLLTGSVGSGTQAVAELQGEAHGMFLDVRRGTLDKAHSAVPETTY